MYWLVPISGHDRVGSDKPTEALLPLSFVLLKIYANQQYKYPDDWKAETKKKKKQERKQNYKDGSQHSVGHWGKHITPLLPVM